MADQRDPVRVLVVTGGHPFERDPFFAVFEANPAITWAPADQPGARELLRPGPADEWDVIVFYDMPGLRFTGGDPPVLFEPPPAEVVDGLTALLHAGTGMVFLHHTVAGWPAWPGYADIVGARFHYAPAALEGREWPDSGYRHDLTHRVEVVAPGHPVVAGLGDGFDITDEVYLFPVLEDRVVPLLRSTAPFTADHFYSADRAIRGHRDDRQGWSHPPGSDLVGWVKHAGRSPVVYLQFGDGPGTYADPSYRRVLANAIDWVASPAAHTWGRARAERLSAESS